VASAHTAWRGVLEERFRRAFPGSVGRVHYAPTMLEGDFFELLESADAVLDPSHFGGGNSSYEAFGLGVPVVTMPGPFMRGRVTLGCYRQMGIDDLVAADPAQYVALAVRLANDAAFREEMRAKVRQHSGALFDDVGAVREMESFFERAFDEALDKARKK
jgi:predicted O-linked N-acetylglucosamine transferase (SPINDLY family)